MNALKIIKSTVLQADLFYSSQLLKYKNESHYKTLTGAIFSIALTIAILFGFSSMIISMFRKTSIEASSEVSKMQMPENIKLSSANNNFMFAFLVHDLGSSSRKYFDLVNGPQIFDYKFVIITAKNGLVQTNKPIILQSCTRQHWKKLPNLVENFDSFQIGKWLCPPLNLEIELEGFGTSDFYKLASFTLKNCTNSTLNGNKCASKESIDNAYNQYGNFMIRSVFINPIINPTSTNYLNHYLQEKNSFIFSSSLGARMTTEFSDYQINTDTTILPLQSIETQKGYIVQDKPTVLPFILKSGQVFARLVMSKSADKITFTRTVLKLSAVISYVGGLIGALISVLFLLKSHTQFSFDMALSTDLFNQQSDENIGDQIKSQKKKLDLGLIKILKFYFYRIKFFFTKDYGDEADLMKKMKRYQKQILKQLDIKFLLQRLIKLEQCVCFLFDEAQIQGLKHIQQVTLQSAQFLRKKLHGTDQQSQNQEENQNQEQRAQGNVENIENKEDIGQSNEIKDKQQAYPQKQFSSYNQDQLSIETLKKQQLTNKPQFIPVQFIKNEKQNPIKSQKSGIIINKTNEPSHLKFKKLKQLKLNANDSIIKQKIWSKMDLDIKKSVKQMIMIDDELQNVSWKQEYKLQKQIME